MSTMASQITSLTIVYSTAYSGADQRKHQSSASLAFVWGIHWGPVNSPLPGEFPTRRASNVENVSIWWCHHDPFSGMHFTICLWTHNWNFLTFFFCFHECWFLFSNQVTILPSCSDIWHILRCDLIEDYFSHVLQVLLAINIQIINS